MRLGPHLPCLSRPAVKEMEIVDLSVGCVRLTLASLRCALMYMNRWSQIPVETRWSLNELPCDAVSEHSRPDGRKGHEEDPWTCMNVCRKV